MALILLIEDDALVRTAIRRVLEGAGHVVIDAAHGGEALARIEQAEIDLVITDLLMPEVEGIEVLTAARRRHPGLPVLVISGGFPPERAAAAGVGADYLRMARQLGATRTLAKPFERADLLAAVEDCLAQRGRDRSSDA
ncbi:MAG: response regulator [Elioraea sp.]|nr:response regulator [Elioraea sp.]MDW8443194.1 response regulator [Acetobacteraceae bacterium]